jgi:mannose-6-phosphate isomerase-like protein (cupin superfamily)
VVSGDPTKAGPFTIQLNMPNGYRIMPHFHPTDEHVAVKSGHFHYGMGDRFDPKAFKSMKPGESGDIPANMHHYAHAQGRTVIEVSSTGPFVLTYVNAKDDPSKMQH